MIGSAESAEDSRTAQLAGNLARLRARIAAGAQAAGRDPDRVTLVAVTKTYPAADVLRLARLGVTEIGENRDQEAATKAAEVARQGGSVRWHFVGRLQRNKCRSVVRYADLVHSVDSERLAAALGAAAATGRDRPLPVLVQVNLAAGAGSAARGGVVPDQLPRVAGAVAGEPALRLAGVMAVAPLGADPVTAFATLARLAERLRAEHPQAGIVSAGMSGDLEAALAAGATHLRIGSDLLGERAPLR